MRRLKALFEKPQGRAARHPRKLEIVFALSGHPSKTLSINLETMRKAAMALALAALAWFSMTFYIAYSHVSNMEAIAKTDAQAKKIAQLKASNASLAEERAHLGERLHNLQQRVEGLAVKLHGLVHSAQARFPVERDHSAPMGGPAIPLTGTDSAIIDQEELAALDERLDALLPRLESTLEREAARPLGAPLDGPIEISSHYGLRANPFGPGYELHSGMDFAGPTGTPVKVTAPGKVDQAGHGGALGNYVAVDHGYGYRSIYGHLSRIAVRPGEPVSKGDVIGLVGSTGRSSGSHLHYTLQYKGKTINPAPYVEH
jgi:murein DD-endopeptidase MepM/ murein hydrolase activator NlpD